MKKKIFGMCKKDLNSQYFYISKFRRIRLIKLVSKSQYKSGYNIGDKIYQMLILNNWYNCCDIGPSLIGLDNWKQWISKEYNGYCGDEEEYWNK